MFGTLLHPALHQSVSTVASALLRNPCVVAPSSPPDESIRSACHKFLGRKWVAKCKMQ